MNKTQTIDVFDVDSLEEYLGEAFLIEYKNSFLAHHIKKKGILIDISQEKLTFVVFNEFSQTANNEDIFISEVTAEAKDFYQCKTWGEWATAQHSETPNKLSFDNGDESSNYTISNIQSDNID